MKWLIVSRMLTCTCLRRINRLESCQTCRLSYDIASHCLPRDFVDKRKQSSLNFFPLFSWLFASPSDTCKYSNTCHMSYIKHDISGPLLVWPLILLLLTRRDVDNAPDTPHFLRGELWLPGSGAPSPEPPAVRQLPMERAQLWLVDLLRGFSSLFEILRVPVKGSKGYTRWRQQSCVCASEWLCVCVRPSCCDRCQAVSGWDVGSVVWAGRLTCTCMWEEVCVCVCACGPVWIWETVPCQNEHKCMRMHLHTLAYVFACVFLAHTGSDCK